MELLNDKNSGDTLPSEEWNQVPGELQNVITGVGISLSEADTNQLGKAIIDNVASGTFYTDVGSANNYLLNIIGSKQKPTAYTDGFQVEFRVGNTNTAGSTVNVTGLGIKNIAESDTGFGRILVAGEIIKLRYNAGSDEFDIVHKINANNSFYTDSGSADDYILTPVGGTAPTDFVDGLQAEFRVGNTNTTISNVTVAGLDQRFINGSSLAGTLRAGEIVKLRYNFDLSFFDIVDPIEQLLAELTPGFIRLKSGFMLQWSGVVMALPFPSQHTFPIAFPNFPLAAVACKFNNITESVGVSFLSTTQIHLRTVSGILTNDEAMYFAIGF